MISLINLRHSPAHMYVLVVVEEAAAHAVFDARFVVAAIQAVLLLPVIPHREPRIIIILPLVCKSIKQLASC